MHNRNRFMGVDLVTLGYIFGGIQIFFYSVIILISTTTSLNNDTIIKKSTSYQYGTVIEYETVVNNFCPLYLIPVIICLTFSIMFVVGISKKNKCLLFPYLGLLSLSTFFGAFVIFYGLYHVIAAESLVGFGIYLVVVLIYVYHVIQLVCGMKLKDSEHFQRRHAMPFFVPQRDNPPLIDNGVPIAISYPNPPDYKF